MNNLVNIKATGRQAAIVALSACALSAAAGTGVQAQDMGEPIAIDNSGPQAVKLVVLLVVFIVILLGMRHVRLPNIMRAGLVWGGMLLALMALYAYRAPLETAGREVLSVLVPGMTVTSGEQVIVRRAYRGHFVIDAEVDGAPVDFLFDTGASLVVLSAEDARRAGFHPETLDFRIPVMTAAGLTRVAPVRIGEIRVGSIRARNVRAAVAQPGDLDASLLGLTFLDRLSGYEVRRDRLVLNP